MKSSRSNRPDPGAITIYEIFLILFSLAIIVSMAYVVYTIKQRPDRTPALSPNQSLGIYPHYHTPARPKDRWRRAYTRL